MAFVLDIGKDVYPPIPTTAQRAEEYVGMVDIITTSTILSGFDYTVGDTIYHFSYGAEDQTNFAQANTSAALSLQLGAMTEDMLKAQFGTKADGSLNTDALPVPLPAVWRMEWVGHVGDRSVTFSFNPMEYLALAGAAGAHNSGTLAEGRVLKAKLRAASSDAELDQIVKDNNIQAQYRVAVESSK